MSRLEGSQIAVTEDDFLMLSGIQHYSFCPRQWGLIHMEQQWEENVLTHEGSRMHRKADDPFFSETRDDILITRSMPLVCASLGLYGVADVVEFQTIADSNDPYKVKLHGRRGWWKPFPVEYKRGKQKDGDFDEVQLCAQAMALEEMLQTEVKEGAIFYGERKRRVAVSFGEGLRQRVRELATAMHAAFRSGITPRGSYAPKCNNCSLLPICKPQGVAHSAVKYLQDYMRTDTD